MVRVSQLNAAPLLSVIRLFLGSSELCMCLQFLVGTRSIPMLLYNNCVKLMQHVIQHQILQSQIISVLL